MRKRNVILYSVIVVMVLIAIAIGVFFPIHFAHSSSKDQGKKVFIPKAWVKELQTISFEEKAEIRRARQRAEAEAKKKEEESAREMGETEAEQTSGESYSYTETANTASYGNLGRLSIPALGIYVALNDGSNSQAVVDAWDSAYCTNFGSTVLIADHCDQAFASLGGAYVGMSATLEYPTYTSYITCIDVQSGTNNGSIFVNGMSVLDRYPGCVIMYTCTYDWQHVLVTAWSAGNGYINTGNAETVKTEEMPQEGYATPTPYEPQTVAPNDGVIILEETQY